VVDRHASLQSPLTRRYVAKEPLEKQVVTLTAEGEDSAKEGSAEARVHAAIPEAGILQTELMAKVGAIGKVGLSRALATQMIRIEKAELGMTVFRKSAQVEDTTAEQLRAIAGGGASAVSAADLDALKKRKLLAVGTVKSSKLLVGESFADWGSGKEVRRPRARPSVACCLAERDAAPVRCPPTRARAAVARRVACAGRRGHHP
jgi:hypothetical protein